MRALRSLLDTGAANVVGEHHTLAVDVLGVRPMQDCVPILIGGHGRRVVRVAARYADIFQFTGLTHGEGGVPGPGGFPMAAVAQRHQWLVEAAGDRLGSIERSVLVQVTDIGDGALARVAALAGRFGLETEVVENTPFVLAGSLAQVVDKLERLRESLGVSHVVVRDADGFAPVVEALAGR